MKRDLKQLSIVRVPAAMLLGTLLLLWKAGGADAAEFGFETTAGVGASDNIGRNDQDEIEETIARVGLLFSLDQSSKRLNADVVGNFAYYDYLDDTFESEFLGNLAADGRFAIVEDRFQWALTDHYGQVLIDPFTPATPENRENLNYFTTGPDVQIPLGAQMQINVGARYLATNYESSDIDSSGMRAELGLARELSPASSLALIARAQQVEYDEAVLDADYDQGEIFLRYGATGSRTHLAVDAGYTEIDQHAAPETQGGMLLRLTMSRRLSSRGYGRLAVGREFSGSGSTFATTQSGSTIGRDEVSGRQTVDPFTSEYATLAWDYSTGRTAFTISANWRDQQFELRPELNQTIGSLFVGARRDLSPTLRLNVDAAFGTGSFVEPGTDYDDQSASVGLHWRMSRSLSLQVTYEYSSRDSELAAANYTENRLWLSLAFERGSPRDVLLNDFQRTDQDREEQ